MEAGRRRGGKRPKFEGNGGQSTSSRLVEAQWTGAGESPKEAGDRRSRRAALRKAFNSQLFALILIVAGIILAVQGMWAIDFVIWWPTHTITVYVPVLGWGIVLGEGNAVNWGYWTISLGLIISVIGGFSMGDSLGESQMEARIGTGRLRRAVGLLAVGASFGVLVAAGYMQFVLPHLLPYNGTSGGALLNFAPAYATSLTILVIGVLVHRLGGRQRGVGGRPF